METPHAPETKKKDRELLDLFRIGVLIKGGQGVLELVAATLVAFIPLDAIARLADHFTEAELAKDPDDFIANHLVDWAHSLSIGAKEYAIVYLILHGVIKIGLAAGLFTGKRWAYPVGIVVISLLVVYQAYRIYLHHSPLLALGTLLDCVILYVIWREYRVVLAREAAASSS